MARQLKNFLRKKKAVMLGCSDECCITLKCWRESNCDCDINSTDNGFYFTGYTFTMPGTKRTWTMSTGSGYVSFKDGDAKFHIVENGSAITPAMVTGGDLIIEDNTQYMKLYALAEEVRTNVAQDGPEAKTEISDDEKAVIVEGFTMLKNNQVWFEWDGITFWNNNNRFPLYDVVDYSGKKLGTQWLLETNGKFAYLEGDEGDKFMDYYEALLQAGATKMKVDYDFSEVIRAGFALNNIASVASLTGSGYGCKVPTASNHMYELTFTNDGTLQLILAEANNVPGVETGTTVTLSNEAEEYITHGWDGWIYIDSVADEYVLGELAQG